LVSADEPGCGAQCPLLLVGTLAPLPAPSVESELAPLVPSCREPLVSPLPSASPGDVTSEQRGHGSAWSCARTRPCREPTICLLLARSNIMSLFTRLQIDPKEPS